MVDGIITFCTPQDCTMRQDVRPMKTRVFGGRHGNFTGLEEASLQQELLLMQQEGGGAIHGLDAETL